MYPLFSLLLYLLITVNVVSPSTARSSNVEPISTRRTVREPDRMTLLCLVGMRTPGTSFACRGSLASWNWWRKYIRQDITFSPLAPIISWLLSSDWHHNLYHGMSWAWVNSNLLLLCQERLTSKDLKRSDLYTTDNNGNTLIMIAAGHNKVKSLEALLADSKSPIDAQHEKVDKFLIQPLIATVCRSLRVKLDLKLSSFLCVDLEDCSWLGCLPWALWKHWNSTKVSFTRLPVGMATLETLGDSSSTDMVPSPPSRTKMADFLSMMPFEAAILKLCGFWPQISQLWWWVQLFWGHFQRINWAHDCLLILAGSEFSLPHSRDNWSATWAEGSHEQASEGNCHPCTFWVFSYWQCAETFLFTGGRRQCQSYR